MLFFAQADEAPAQAAQQRAVRRGEHAQAGEPAERIAGRIEIRHAFRFGSDPSREAGQVARGKLDVGLPRQLERHPQRERDVPGHGEAP